MLSLGFIYDGNSQLGFIKDLRNRILRGPASIGFYLNKVHFKFYSAFTDSILAGSILA